LGFRYANIEFVSIIYQYLQFFNSSVWKRGFHQKTRKTKDPEPISSVFSREIFLLLLQRIFGLKLYNIYKTVKQIKAYPPLFP